MEFLLFFVCNFEISPKTLNFNSIWNHQMARLWIEKNTAIELPVTKNDNKEEKTNAVVGSHIFSH